MSVFVDSQCGRPGWFVGRAAIKVVSPLSFTSSTRVPRLCSGTRYRRSTQNLLLFANIWHIKTYSTRPPCRFVLRLMSYFARPQSSAVKIVKPPSNGDDIGKASPSPGTPGTTTPKKGGCTILKDDWHYASLPGTIGPSI